VRVTNARSAAFQLAMAHADAISGATPAFKRQGAHDRVRVTNARSAAFQLAMAHADATAKRAARERDEAAFDVAFDRAYKLALKAIER
jgi:hypothetical protein